MDKKVQLFLLPYAGGNSFSFYKVSRFLDPRYEIIPIEYSGRGTRTNEDLIKDYDLFLEDVIACIKNKRNKQLPFFILGYSLGCPILYDIIVNKKLGENPKYLFFCAEGSLKKNGFDGNLSGLTKEDFLDKIISLGGIDERFLLNPDLLNEVLPIIWNDFSVYSQFRYSNKVINIDSSVIYSLKDKSCVCMDEWKDIINSDFVYYEIGDSHFFLNKQFREFAQIINSKLEIINLKL